MKDSHDQERRGLWLSIVGAVFMAVLGIGFAILTSSDAVLLDGLFSLVGCVVGMLALRVATLVMQPDDDIFHFGYAAYEPMLNLTKGLLMAFVTLFALVSAIGDVLVGGREIHAGWASVYAVIAALGCFAIALVQWRLSQKTHSPLLEVDTKNWLVDGMLSSAVAVAFIIAVLLAGTRYAHLLPYADPTVVIVLVLISFPIPAQIIRENWNQLLGKAPDAALQVRAREGVEQALRGASAIDINMRMQQIGRFTYVQLYVTCDGKVETGLGEFDRCRRAVAEALAGEFEHLALDVVFTRDPHWVAASIGNTKHATTVVPPTVDMPDASDASLAAKDSGESKPTPEDAEAASTAAPSKDSEPSEVGRSATEMDVTIDPQAANGAVTGETDDDIAPCQP